MAARYCCLIGAVIVAKPDCRCCLDRERFGCLVINFNCLDCVAESVRRARPSRHRQERVLGQLCQLGRIERDDVLMRLKR